MCAASEVRSVLEDDATSVGPHSTDFWILAAALKRFIDGEGQGSLPLEVINLVRPCTCCKIETWPLVQHINARFTWGVRMKVVSLLERLWPYLGVLDA